jgi:hypothetical protein
VQLKKQISKMPKDHEMHPRISLVDFPLLPWSSRQSSKASIVSILREAEEIIEESPLILDPTPIVVVEPTPLGPQGVENVVKDLPLTDYTWHADAAFASLLVPLLRSTIKRPLSCKSCTIVSKEPLHKKHRASWTAGRSVTKKKTRSSYTTSREENYDSDEMEAKERFRTDQAEQWNDRFADLVEFRNEGGHCLVPHNFAENPPLAQWVKRQRYQHKLKQLKRHSTLTDEREAKLDAMGFSWDSHKAVWEEKYKALCSFREKHGHSNVPTKNDDKALAIWVKCQRRQYKLFLKGDRSAMNTERISKLESVDFIWNPRNL